MGNFGSGVSEIQVGLIFVWVKEKRRCEFADIGSYKPCYRIDDSLLRGSKFPVVSDIKLAQ